MNDAIGRLTEILRAEARVADQGPDQEGELLRELADTTSNMTPAERSWAEQASDEELRGFVKALRLGCPPEER
jgi:hypothetical protein